MGENREWLVSLVPYAQAAKAEWSGMRVSCCLAQAALETGWGRKMIGGFNYWGIKAMSWIPGSVEVATTEVVNGQRVPMRLLFAAFDTPQAAFNAYGRLVTNSHYYEKARDAASLDEYIEELGEHWATDKAYGAKVRVIVNALDLRQYDET